MSYDKVIFGKKSLSDLLKEIHTNSKETRQQILALIRELQPLVENIGDATLVVPLIKDYLDMKIKNDEIIVKMVGIIQRMETSTSKDGDDPFSLAADDIMSLLEDSEEVKDQINPEEDTSTDE